MALVVAGAAFQLAGIQPRPLQRKADSGRTVTRWICPDCGAWICSGPKPEPTTRDALRVRDEFEGPSPLRVAIMQANEGFVHDRHHRATAFDPLRLEGGRGQRRQDVAVAPAELGPVLDASAEKSRLAHTRLVQLALYLAVTLVARADALPIELKALVDQVVAIGLHFLLIDRRGSRGRRRGGAHPLRGSEY